MANKALRRRSSAQESIHGIAQVQQPRQLSKRQRFEQNVNSLQIEFNLLKTKLLPKSQQKLDGILNALSGGNAEDSQLARRLQNLQLNWPRMGEEARADMMQAFLEIGINEAPSATSMFSEAIQQIQLRDKRLKQPSDYGIKANTTNESLRKIVNRMQEFNLARLNDPAMTIDDFLEQANELKDVLEEVLGTVEDFQEDAEKYAQQLDEMDELSDNEENLREILESVEAEIESLEENGQFADGQEVRTIRRRKKSNADKTQADLSWDDYVLSIAVKSQRSKERTKHFAILKDSMTNQEVATLIAKEIKDGHLVLMNDGHGSSQARNEEILEAVMQQVDGGLLMVEAPSEIEDDLGDVVDNIEAWEKRKLKKATNITPFARIARDNGKDWSVLPIDGMPKDGDKDTIVRHIFTDSAKATLDQWWTDNGQFRTVGKSRREAATEAKRKFQNDNKSQYGSALRQEWIGNHVGKGFVTATGGALLVIGTLHIEGKPGNGFRHLRWILTGKDDKKLKPSEKILQRKNDNLNIQIIKKDKVQDKKQFDDAIDVLDEIKDE